MTKPESVPCRENALLRDIPGERLGEAGLALDAVEFPPGEIIFEEGADGDWCYLVERGQVRISKSTPDGSQETLGYVGPGDFFGELALFYSSGRAARATSTAATRAWRLCRSDFDRLREVAPLEVTTAVASAGIEHLRELHAEIVTRAGDSDRFRELGMGIAVLAHDMRSPLATIKTAAELLGELIEAASAEPAKLRKFADMIQRTAKNALTMTDQILAGVRGQVPRADAVMTIGALAEEAMEQARAVASGKPIDLVVQVEQDGILRGDRVDLVRALVNLVRNAIEALPEQGGRVQLRAGMLGGATVFEVSDTGSGIPPAVLDRIFERRFTHGKPGGTGLGLGQVRAAVERLKGRIDVESEVGRGTTFRVRIPVPLEPGVADREAVKADSETMAGAAPASTHIPA